MSEFIGYIGSPEIHDGSVLGVEHDGDWTRVVIRSEKGYQFALEFLGVESVESNQPEGMIVYALCEMKADAPLRSFVFTNWDEDDDASLEILAREIRIVGTNNQRTRLQE